MLKDYAWPRMINFAPAFSNNAGKPMDPDSLFIREFKATLETYLRKPFD